MLDSLIFNKEALQQTVVIKDLNVDKDVRSNVLDEESFWPKVTSCLETIQPVPDAILKIEGDSAVLSDVPEIFYDLSRTVIAALESAKQSKLKKQVEKIISYRKEFSCQPVHFAANLLDPRYKGEHLSKDEILSAIDYVNQVADHLHLDCSKVMANLAEYRMNSDLWSRESVRNAAKSIKPHVWWQGMCAGEELTPIAARLLRLPPHSISSERVWSGYGRIHSKTRNRLKNEKVQKLVTLQMSLRLQSGQYPKKRSSKRKIRSVRQDEQEKDTERDLSDRSSTEDSSSEDDDWDEEEDIGCN